MRKFACIREMSSNVGSKNVAAPKSELRRPEKTSSELLRAP